MVASIMYLALAEEITEKWKLCLNQKVHDYFIYSCAFTCPLANAHLHFSNYSILTKDTYNYFISGRTVEEK